MMRLIDADVLIAEICQDQCERKYCDCDYTCSVVAPIVNAPTIPAVPMDKLCEWLSEHSCNIPCETCRNFSNDYCTAIGDMDKPCHNKAEDWQRVIKGWMEEQDAAD